MVEVGKRPPDVGEFATWVVGRPGPDIDYALCIDRKGDRALLRFTLWQQNGPWHEEWVTVTRPTSPFGCWKTDRVEKIGKLLWLERDAFMASKEGRVMDTLRDKIENEVFCVYHGGGIDERTDNIMTIINNHMEWTPPHECRFNHTYSGAYEITSELNLFYLNKFVSSHNTVDEAKDAAMKHKEQE